MSAISASEDMSSDRSLEELRIDDLNKGQGSDYINLFTVSLPFFSLRSV